MQPDSIPVAPTPVAPSNPTAERLQDAPVAHQDNTVKDLFTMQIKEHTRQHPPEFKDQTLQYYVFRVEGGYLTNIVFSFRCK